MIAFLLVIVILWGLLLWNQRIVRGYEEMRDRFQHAVSWLLKEPDRYEDYEYFLEKRGGDIWLTEVGGTKHCEERDSIVLAGKLKDGGMTEIVTFDGKTLIVKDELEVIKKKMS